MSGNALARVEALAREAGVAGRIETARHDLAETFPEGTFDAVCAMYLETPVDFPRDRVLRRAARSVAPGGLFLVVSHGSAPPWSWASPETVFPAPEEALAAIGLDRRGWTTEFLGAPERTATGPGGQTATVADTVIALRRAA